MIIVLTRLNIMFFFNLQASHDLNTDMILKVKISEQKAEINMKMWSVNTHVYAHIPILFMYNTQTYTLSLQNYFSRPEIVIFAKV